MQHQFKEVVLGFAIEPKNQLVLQPEYTPSKIGGHPAWISPKSIPSQWCPHCDYKMTFLLQLYANIEESKFDDFHRMLYVFTCLSEKCIGTQNAIKCYSAIVPHDNNLGIKFASDDEYNKIWDKTPNQLRALGIEMKTQKSQEEDKTEQDQIDSSANPEDETEEYDRELAKKR